MTGRRFLTRLGRLVRSLVALAFVVALLVGPPYLLWRYIGWPLPNHMPTWEDLKVWLTTPLTNQILINTLACVVWVVWANLALSLLSEAVAAVRDTPVPRLPAVAPLQAFAAALIAAIALSIPSPRSGVRDTTPDATLAAHATDSAIVAPAHPGHEPEAAQKPDPAAPRWAVRNNSASEIHTVERGDTLWDIAEDEYGRGSRYWRIYHATEGRSQPHGLPEVTDPDVIYPGQRLWIPEHDSDNQPPPPQHGEPQDDPRDQPSGTPSPQDDPRDHQPSGTPSPQATAAPGVPDTETPQPPTPSPTPSQTSPLAPRPAGPDDAEIPDDEQRDPPSAVLELPSGGLVGISLVVALGAAITLARLHRRRRRLPARVPGVAEPEPPLSPTLRRLRRAYLEHLRRSADDSYADLDDDRNEPGPSRDAQMPEPPPYAPRDDFAIAAHDGHEVLVDLPRLGGLGLQGPGADGVARAIMAAVLAVGNADDTEIVIPESDLRRLLGSRNETDELWTPPTLTVTSTYSAALGHIETELIHRTRLLENYDSIDFATLRREHPDEPLPTVVLVVTSTPEMAPRCTTVLTLGRMLGIAGVFIGTAPSGTNCRIDENGRVAEGDPGLEQIGSGQLFHLPAADSADLLAILAEARSGAETKPQAPSGADRQDRHRDRDASQGDQVPPAPRPPQDPLPASISVFGQVRVYADGEEILTGLRSNSRELLAYLAAHPDGVSLDGALRAMWTDTEPGRAAVHFRAAVGNIRKVFRLATGSSEAAFVSYAAKRYRLDPQMVDVDLWRFWAALGDAAHAKGQAAQAAALARIEDIYGGDFTEDHDYEWAEPLRETLRRNAIDAFVRLAELNDGPDVEHALKALDTALIHDPYNEELYRRTMALLGRHERYDAVRRTLRLLRARLAEIDADPSPATQRLASELLRRAEARNRFAIRASSPRPHGQEEPGGNAVHPDWP